MTSFIQADTIAFCRKCGKPLSEESRRELQGIPYCQPCLEQVQESDAERQKAAPPAAASLEAGSRVRSQAEAPGGSFNRATEARYSPLPAPQRRSPGGTVSPVLAGILGFVPGVGAIYNGQFAKGILHAMIFGLLVSIIAAEGTGDLTPLFVFLVILAGIYMPIEAYRTARRIERGQPVDEFSGVLSVFGGERPSPAGGIGLIIIGVVFLLNTLGYWRLSELVPYWPVLLIALGIFMLYRSVSEQAREDRSMSLGRGAPRGEPGSLGLGSDPAGGEQGEQVPEGNSGGRASANS